MGFEVPSLVLGLLVALTGLVSLFLVPAVIRVCTRLQITDRPGTRKIHSVCTPRLGGVAIFLSAILGVGLVIWLRREAGGPVPLERVMFLGAPTAFAIGLWDDVRRMRSSWKLAAQLVLGTVAFFAGFRIEEISLGLGYQVSLGRWAYPVTILWVATVMNAVNLIDGMDGLAAGVASIALALTGVCAYMAGNGTAAVWSFAILGSTLGFLSFNYPPAKIFMGDSGSMFLGFSLSVLTMNVSAVTVPAPVLVPLFLLALPLTDTVVAVLRRVIRAMDENVGWGPVKRRKLLRNAVSAVFSADGDHIHHRLLARGHSHGRVVSVLYALSAVAGGLALAMMFLPAFLTWMLAAGGALAASQLVLSLEYDEFLPRSRRLAEQEAELRRQFGAPPAVLRRVSR